MSGGLTPCRQLRTYRTYRNNSIFVTVNIPLLTQAVILDVFKVLSVPVPLHRGSPHVSQLLDIPRYISFSADGLYYTTPDPDKWLTCGKHQSNKFCQIDTPLIQSSTPSCLTAIYNQQMTLVKSLCNFRFLEHTLPSSVINIKPGIFLMSNISHLTMTCASSVQTTPGCDYCVMEMPCLCAVSAGHFYIPPHLQNCGVDASNKVSKLHPVNLALLLHFKDMENINHLDGNTLFPHPVDFPTPKFKLYNHTFATALAQDVKEHLSLKHMVAKAKANAVIYRNLAEPVLTDIDADPSSIIGPSSNWLWFFIPTIISDLALLGTIYLFCKFRTLAAYVAILKQNAVSVNKVINLFSSTTTEPTSPSPPLVDVCTHDIASYMVASAIVITVCYLLYKAYNRNKHHSTVFLELSTGSKCVKIPVSDLPLFPRNFHFQATLGSSVRQLVTYVHGVRSFNYN